MKKIIFTTVLITLSIMTAFGQKNWGDWSESNVSGVYYRVAYDYYNEYAEKEGKPAHVWCLEISNRNESQIGVSWCIGDKGQSFDSIKDKRRNSFMKSNKVEKSCLHFTNTPRDGIVTIYIWTKENSENTKVSDDKESYEVRDEEEPSNDSNKSPSNKDYRSPSEAVVGTWVSSRNHSTKGIKHSYTFLSNGTGYQILPDEKCVPYYYKSHFRYKVNDKGGIDFWFTKIDDYCGYQYNAQIVREIYPKYHVLDSNEILSGAFADGEGATFKKE
jgi:hypothetical protein